ncbi:hypothetical protein MRX96_019055 [Rhipicephalus microplus]
MFAPSAPLDVREAVPQRPRRKTAAYTCAEPREISGSELAIAPDMVCAACEPQAPPQVVVATRSAAIRPGGTRSLPLHWTVVPFVGTGDNVS